ncbi:glycoside hydrolase family 32 protein [Salipaludibacillus sp. HK11]|uniref:glycoside hydrolase family 32 protein n=1 Tax=Salipaludibacillus sp. HK11 TaxID=3394320 RepID=UPI0039FDD393
MTGLVTEFSRERADQFIKEKLSFLPSSAYRPAYHITAPLGWINDPNGLVYFRGEYHAFYQFYPYDTEWGPMHWGHVKSKDLLHWEHLPVAIAPEYDYEKEGCFSGSAVVRNDKMYLIYTGHNEKNSPKEVQCIAVSDDGIHFEKLATNPVIAAPPENGSEDFRDPKVTYIDGVWYMFIGTAYHNEGKAIYYTSKDLENWEYGGVLLESDGTQGTMWECVDFFPLDGYDVLIFSPMELNNSKTKYIVGHWNGGTFERVTEGEIDLGPDFYAPQTFEDGQGRRLMIGWMNMWKKSMEEKKEGWAGALTMPRELAIKNERLVMQAPTEWQEKKRQRLYSAEEISSGEERAINVTFSSLYLHASVETTASSTWAITSVAGDTLSIRYDANQSILFVDRRDMHYGDKDEIAIPLDKSSDELTFDGYIDHSSLELLINKGEEIATFRVYFKDPNVTIKQHQPGTFIVEHF